MSVGEGGASTGIGPCLPRPFHGSASTWLAAGLAVDTQARPLAGYVPDVGHGRWQRSGRRPDGRRRVRWVREAGQLGLDGMPGVRGRPGHQVAPRTSTPTSSASTSRALTTSEVSAASRSRCRVSSCSPSPRSPSPGRRTRTSWRWPTSSPSSCSTASRRSRQSRAGRAPGSPRWALSRSESGASRWPSRPPLRTASTGSPSACTRARRASPPRPCSRGRRPLPEPLPRPPYALLEAVGVTLVEEAPADRPAPDPVVGQQ